jgi:hypothetical protein
MSGIQVDKLSQSESYKNKGNDNGLDSRLRGNDGEVAGEIYLCLEKIKLYAKES